MPRRGRPGGAGRAAGLDPAATNRSPPDMTSLLAAVWRDEAPAGGLAAMRRVLALQVWPHRLAAGFRRTTWRWREDRHAPAVAQRGRVVELPGGRRCAAAVFTRSPPVLVDPAADAAIGTAAGWRWTS